MKIKLNYDSYLLNLLVLKTCSLDLCPSIDDHSNNDLKMVRNLH